MVEGLAAIGLAGNIVQFITFSAELISKSREIYHSATGLSSENIDLEIISQDIAEFNNQILSNVRSSQRFTDLALRCQEVATELRDAISEIQVKAQAQGGRKGPTKWQSFRKALKSVWEKKHIEELKARLEWLRDQVILHLVSNTSDGQRHLLGLLETWKNENVHLGYKITEQIRALDNQLQSTQKQISQIHSEGYWKKLQEHFSRISSQVQQLSKCHTIIKSLQYECMRTRHVAIKDAHKRTFEWIFRSQQSRWTHSCSKVGYTEWLQGGSEIYWVTGKPGSGKSTLMKYLYDHEETARHLRIWSGHEPVVRASFYFWNPGMDMQKSLEGLLQSLLYQILHAYPDLVPTLCPDRWNDTQSQHDISGPWTLAELQQALSLLKTQCLTTKRFYFHIDGLDEYYGDHWDVIETMKSLSQSPNVKLCISSRPWNCFQDAFGRSRPHMLQLHELTRDDIEQFARETLISYCRDIDFEQSLFDDLVADIGARAQGVFLWVRLVVRSLRDGISNGDPISLLHERLKAIPLDLERFFEQILGSVEDLYRTRMASTFLSALETHRPLKMIHYYFLEQEDTTFGLDLPSKVWRESQIQRRVIQTQRRLNGRFKGLLEPASTNYVGSQTTVDFLHRTLRDFLATERMKKMLEVWAARELNVFTAISRALIAESKFIDLIPSKFGLDLAVSFADRGAAETGDTAHYFAILDQVELAYERRRCSPGNTSMDLPVTGDTTHFSCGTTHLTVRAAISTGHIEYLRYRLRKKDPILDLDRLLRHAINCTSNPGAKFASVVVLALYQSNTSGDSHHCLRHCSSIDYIPSISMIEMLLDHGADPNQSFEGISTWSTLLGQMIGWMDREQHEQRWDIVCAFLRKGADLRHCMDQWYYMLNRERNTTEQVLRNTLMYFQRFFAHGLSPNTRTKDTTISTEFFRILAKDTSNTSAEAQSIQIELLREFLRFGADVTTIYRDTSSGGWLNMVSHELVRHSTSTFPSMRILQLRMMLEHGMNPNANILQITVWEQLLDAISSGLQRVPLDKTYHHTIYQIVLLALDYGADPHAAGLQDVLRWMKGSSRLLPAEVSEIERAIQREIDQKRAQELLYKPGHLHSTDEVAVEFGGYVTTDNRAQLRQGQKRNAEHMSHSGHGSSLKRVRFDEGSAR